MFILSYTSIRYTRVLPKSNWRKIRETRLIWFVGCRLLLTYKMVNAMLRNLLLHVKKRTIFYMLTFKNTAAYIHSTKIFKFPSDLVSKHLIRASLMLKKQWYFVSKIVLTSCEKKIVLVIFFWWLVQFIRTLKGQKFFWNRRFFKLIPGGFFRSNKFEQLWFKLEKVNWDLEACRKCKKNHT